MGSLSSSARCVTAESPRSRFSIPRSHATALVDLLRRHIDRENIVLFMMVSQMLSDEECETLAKAVHDFRQTRQQAVWSTRRIGMQQLGAGAAMRRTDPRRQASRRQHPFQKTNMVF